MQICFSGWVAIPIALVFLWGVSSVIQAFGRRARVSIGEVLRLEGGFGLGEMIADGAVSEGDGSSDTAMAVPLLVPGTVLAGVRGISFGVGMVVVILVILAMAGAAASLPTVVAELPATTVGGMGVSSVLRIAGRSFPSREWCGGSQGVGPFWE